MYIESSLPRRNGEVAILTGPVLPPSSGVCWLRFYYNMYGSSIGTLRVVLIDQNNVNLGQVFSLSGNQGTN